MQQDAPQSMNLEGCDRQNTLLDISLVLEAERDEFTTDIRLVTHFSDSIMVILHIHEYVHVMATKNTLQIHE